MVTKSAGRDSKELITRAAVRRLLILEVLAIERVLTMDLAIKMCLLLLEEHQNIMVRLLEKLNAIVQG